MRTVLVLAAVWGLVSAAVATPYASGIQSLGGGDYSFVLNQAADNVVVERSGDTPLNLGALAKGTYTFNQGAGTGFQVKAYSSTPTAWTQYSSDTNLIDKFYSPRGVAVNRNASSSSFGTIYVSNSTAGSTANPVRASLRGFYGVRADQTEIVSGQTGGVAWPVSANSPFKVTVAPDSRLYISDYSDAHSGVWRAPANLLGAYDEMLYNVNRAGSGLVLNPDSTPLHGSIPSVWVEGTGAGTMMYTMDEDLPDAGVAPYPHERGDIKRYPVGTGTSYTGAYATVVRDGTPSPDGVILNGQMDFVRAADGSWWATQSRAVGQDIPGTPALTHWADGGTAPLFNSGNVQDYNGDGLDDFVLGGGYGDLDIWGHYLALGGQSGVGVFVIDISNPDAPLVVATIPQTGLSRDVSFDAAGNLYVVSNSSETLRIWSPGGDWLAITRSDGTFSLLPEPASMLLLALGLLLRRR